MRCALALLIALSFGCTAPAPGTDDSDGMLDAIADAMPDDTPDAMADAMPEETPDVFERVLDAAPADSNAPDAAVDLGPPDAIAGETCDGTDEDGDGVVDEGFAVGAPCAVGLGVCAAAGAVECVDGRARCVGEPGAPGDDDPCNGLDDDCDGLVDEQFIERACYPGPPRTLDVGACRGGRSACVAGAEACVEAIEPITEQCDGLDRDCDGAIDEGCAGCGDGEVGPGEGCDDGNRLGGDGCAPDCTLEGAGLLPGIQRDVSFDAIADRGWRPCHVSLYRDGGEPLDDVLAACAGSHLLIGCAPVGGDRLTVAAEGAFAEVTADVGDGNGAVNRHNGVDFYFSRAASWGFAPAGAGVNRNTCDVQDEASPERLCWHTQADAFRGGWRCGSAVRLNESGGWQRLIFTRRQVELGPARGFGAHGICGDFNGCVDAAGCARAACEHFGQGPPLSWREGLCDAEAGLDCDLFGPDGLDADWLPGCAMPVAYDVVCDGGAPLVCGDGRLDPGEGCDDGGRVAGDGCAPDCTLERPLEAFVGPRSDVSVGDLVAGGFTACFEQPYEAVFDLAAAREACPGEEWVVGCRPSGQPGRLTLAAMGEVAVITDPVAAEAGAFREHNGARWYYTDDFSFGFAGPGSPLNRDPCDTGASDAEQRLCWHTIDLGGWRCGATTGLNRSAEWQRVILSR